MSCRFTSENDGTERYTRVPFLLWPGPPKMGFEGRSKGGFGGIHTLRANCQNVSSPVYGKGMKLRTLSQRLFCTEPFISPGKVNFVRLLFRIMLY